MCKPDIDGPGYTAGVSADICCVSFDSDFNAATGLIYLINEFNVLFVYGRYYAGGDINNDIEDMIAGLRFLGTQSNVDSTKIGITGKSWGGFEALYAALYAPDNVKPAVVVPVYPVIDFSRFTSFIDSELPALISNTVLEQYNQFYDPFLRRMHAHLGQKPTTNYTGYTINDLSARLTMPMLIPHDDDDDDADTILPAQNSHQLVSDNALAEGFWYTRSKPGTVPWETVITSHGKINNTIVSSAYETFTSQFMMKRLANTEDSIVLVYGQQDMLQFFNTIKTYQMTGLSVSWLTPRLIELCDSRVQMYDLTPEPNKQNVISGALFVAQWLNLVWNRNLTDLDVEQFLLTNGLPKP